jgi:protein tyrosine phosphatase (PTP) superfamily phosphohydrolase (DUF442 family)
MYQPKPFRTKKKNPVLIAIERVVYAVKTVRGPMQTRWQVFVAHIESFFIDDGFLSYLFPNRHRLSKKMWRSSQPHYLQIGGLAKKGIRTIINLRGARDCATFYLEEKACRKHGITLVNFPVNSRQPPKREIIEQLEKLFAEIDYPALMHCKAGSDRAGIMSALYLLIAEKQTIKKAKKQLSLRYGHVRHAKTGVLLKFLETYQEFSAKKKTDFMTWAREHYDRDAVIASHKIFSWAEWITSRALRRE